MLDTGNRKWRVLVVHCYYKQRGGEDVVFETETAAMEAAGWEVDRLTGHNDELDQYPAIGQAIRTIWNHDWANRVRQRVRDFHPDVVHFHNTFPLMSPAVLWAAKRQGVAVVQTLHNYRLGCLNGVLFRDSRICTQCVGRAPIAGMVHGCYRGVKPSAVVAGMYALHRSKGTYRKAVDRFVLLTEASIDTYVRMGVPRNKIFVKPNFLHPDPPVGSGCGGYVVFVGRLSVEKGIGVLLEAWRSDQTLPSLKIMGDGPMRSQVEEAVSQLPNVEYLGQQNRETVAATLRGADLLVMPSLWYETCGMVMVEAFASGTPVAASQHPQIAENLGLTGVLFDPRKQASLAGAVRSAIGSRSRSVARQWYEAKYSSASGLMALDALYYQATKRGTSSATPITSQKDSEKLHIC